MTARPWSVTGVERAPMGRGKLRTEGLGTRGSGPSSYPLRTVYTRRLRV